MCQQRRAANGSDAKCAASLAAFISPPGMMSARRANIPSTAWRAASRLGIPPTANRTSAVLLKAVSTGPDVYKRQAPNGVNGDETLQDVQVVNVTYTISLAA